MYNRKNNELIKKFDNVIGEYLLFLAEEGMDLEEIDEQLKIIVDDNISFMKTKNSLLYKEKLIQLKANIESDGHYILMKFTTNWRFMFGTFDDSLDIREQIENCISAKTKEELFDKVLNIRSEN